MALHLLNAEAEVFLWTAEALSVNLGLECLGDWVKAVVSVHLLDVFVWEAAEEILQVD